MGRQGGGDPVPMLYSKLISNEAEVLPEYYLKQYQKEGGSLDAWELLEGIGLESGVISYGGLYTLLTRLDFDAKGTAEHFTVTGADGHSYEFSYSFWEEKEMDWTNNQTITLPVWYHLRDGYPVGIEDETNWMYRGPVVDLKGGWNIDTHNGYFHFYMPFWEITGLNASWD